MRIRWWVAPGIAATAALLAACGSSSASGSGSGAASPAGASATAAASSAPAAAAKPGTSAAGLTTAKTAKGTVLVTAQGYAVYMFAIDTPTKSNCDATCLTFWPALTGTPTAASGSGLSGKFGTITGTGGITQATFDGHPLYLFAADKKPGEVNGNGINTSGGLWYALTPSGAKLAAAAKPAASATSGSTGGYGY